MTLRRVYPQVNQAIKSSGNTNVERAKNLGIHLRALYRWKKGNIPSEWLYLLYRPQLLQALAVDLGVILPCVPATQPDPADAKTPQP